MTESEKVATLRAALEKVHLHGNYCTGRDVDKHDAIIDAALAATAEPVCSHCDGTRREPFMGKTPCGACVLSPAPRDAEREALLAFGEKVKDETLAARRRLGEGESRKLVNVAALLPVRK